MCFRRRSIVLLIAGLCALQQQSAAEARLPAFAADPINSAGGFIPVSGQQQIPRLDGRSSSPSRSSTQSGKRSPRSSHLHPRCALISAGENKEVLRGGSDSKGSTGGGGGGGGGGNSMPPTPAPGHKYKINPIEGVLSYVNLWPKHSQVLNAGSEVCSEEGDSNSNSNSADLGVQLRKSVTAVYGAHVTEDGSGVDYASLGASEEFKEYTSLAKQLANVKVEDMEEGEKVAFFINTYNSLLIHAFAAMGTPGNMLSRLRLYAVASYRIGGHVYSLNDIENGILRGNEKGPTPNAKRPFGSGDPRAALACKKPDARIHFALNCGARGCPPIRFYRAEQIEKDLERATQAFCGGVDVKEESGEVGLSMIFKWYDKDFSTGGDAGVLAWIIRNLPEGDAKRVQLEGLVKDGKAKVKHLDYDWGLNKK